MASACAADPRVARRAMLMVVRVQGRAAASAVAEAVAVSIDAARTMLEQAVERGEVRRIADQQLWALTEQGRLALIAVNAAAGVDIDRLAAHYARFLTCDAGLKQAITAWQDDRSPRQLGAVRAAAVGAATLIDLLAAVDRRYAVYARRFERACARLGAGDADAVAKPATDSVHQVWFELHEDLLVMLGRARSS